MSIKHKIIQDHPWYFAITKGVRLQEKVMAKSPDDKVVVWLQLGGNRVISTFKDKDDFYRYYTEYKGPRSFYYVNRSFQVPEEKCIFYLDIEWSTPTKDTQAKSKLAKIEAACEFPLLIEDLSRQKAGGYYNSFHLYAPDKIFEHNCRDGGLYSFVVDGIWANKLAHDPEMYQDGKSIIDTKVYTKNRQWRVPGSSKPTADTQRSLPTKSFFMETRQSDRRGVEVEFTPKRVLEMYPVLQREQQPGKKRKRQTGNINQSNARHEHQDTVEKILRAKGDQHTQVYFNQNTGLITGRTDPTHGRTCLVGHEHNVSDNCYFTMLKNGEVRYHCHDAETHEKGAYVNIGNLNSDKYIKWSRDNEFIGESATFELPTGVNVKEFNSEYVNSFLPDDPGNMFGPKIITVKAGEGSGKSTRAAELIELYKNLRILIISTRRSLSFSQRKLFEGFTHYSEEKAEHADRVIWQYESLHRLENVNKFDLVILDETRSLMSNLTSIVTNKGNLKTNYDLLKAYIKHSKLTVCLDADMEVDSAVYDYLTQIVNPSAIMALRYNRPKIYRELQCTVDEDRWIKRIAKQLKNGEKVAIVSRTKTHAEVLFELFSKKYISKIYTGDTLKSVMEKDMRDPNLTLANVQLTIITSALSVGVDITTRYDHVHMSAKGFGGATARAMLQMAARWRALGNTTVHTLFGDGNLPKHKDIATALSEAKQHVMMRQRFTDEHRAALTFERDFSDDGIAVVEPSAFTRLYITTHAERNMVDFKYELFRQSKLKGYKVFWADRSEDITRSKHAEKAAVTVKETKKATQERVFQKVNSIPQCEVFYNIEHIERKKQASLETTDDLVTLDQLHVVKHYETGIQDVKELDRATKNTNAIVSMAAIIFLSGEELLQREQNSFQSKVWHTYTSKSIYIQLKWLLGMCGKLGFVDTLTNQLNKVEEKEETLIPLQMFRDHRHEIISSMKKCAAANKMRVCNKHLKDSEEDSETDHAIVVFRQQLKRVIGTNLKMVRTGKAGRNRRVFYKVVIDPKILDLVYRSDFMRPETDDAMDVEQLEEEQHNTFENTAFLVTV